MITANNTNNTNNTSDNTNNTKTTKKMSIEQKAAMAEKRAKSPSFAAKQSATRKLITFAQRRNVSELLRLSKNIFAETEVLLDMDKVMENKEIHVKCRKFINYILKNTDASKSLLESFTQLQKIGDNGLYTQYRIEQSVGRVIKYVDAKNVDYTQAINALIAKDKA
jgi:hypothetical protein